MFKIAKSQPPWNVWSGISFLTFNICVFHNENIHLCRVPPFLTVAGLYNLHILLLIKGAICLENKTVVLT